jgi:hypothetical protein
VRPVPADPSSKSAQCAASKARRIPTLPDRARRCFRGYYPLDGGPGVLISIGLFESADDALASNEHAADWVRNNVLEFTKGMPEVMVGTVLVAEEARVSEPG